MCKFQEGTRAEMRHEGALLRQSGPKGGLRPPSPILFQRLPPRLRQVARAGHHGSPGLIAHDPAVRQPDPALTPQLQQALDQLGERLAPYGARLVRRNTDSPCSSRDSRSYSGCAVRFPSGILGRWQGSGILGVSRL